MLGEQGVPRRPRHRRPQESRVGIRSEQAGDQPSGVRGAETVQRQPLRDLEPCELGEPAGERGAGDDGVSAVRDDENRTLAAQVAGQEAHEVESGPVGPVHVLHHEHDRSRRSESLQQSQHRLEEAQLRGQPQLRGVLGSGGHESGDQPAQLGRAFELQVERPAPAESSQRLAERSERHRVTCHGHAPAVQRRAVPGRDELAHESGLAHAGLPGHENDRRRALGGPPQRGPQHSEAQVTTDQGGRWTPHHTSSSRPTALSSRLLGRRCRPAASADGPRAIRARNRVRSPCPGGLLLVVPTVAASTDHPAERSIEMSGHVDTREARAPMSPRPYR